MKVSKMLKFLKVFIFLTIPLFLKSADKKEDLISVNAYIIVKNGEPLISNHQGMHYVLWNLKFSGDSTIEDISKQISNELSDGEAYKIVIMKIITTGVYLDGEELNNGLNSKSRLKDVLDYHGLEHKITFNVHLNRFKLIHYVCDKCSEKS